MIRSLRFRLLCTLAIVVAITVGTMALLASQVSTSELQRYADLDLERRNMLLKRVLAFSNEYSGLQDTQMLAREIARDSGERVVIVGDPDTVLADSADILVGQSIGCADVQGALVVSIGQPGCIELYTKGVPGTAADPKGDILFVGETVSAPAAASVVAQPGFMLDAVRPVAKSGAQHIAVRWSQAGAADPIKAGFASAVNRSLLLAAFAAGVAALLLTAVLSRRILGPVEALTDAARAMERGDLSRRVEVRVDDEIGELARSFNSMADGLARVEQLRRTMVTDIAHELRTPLTNIRGYLEALRDGVADPEPALIDSLHEEALLLNRLIDDLQDLAIADAGQLRLERQLLSPGALADQAASMARPSLAERGLQLQLECDAELPAIDGDARRIGQVLRNLLANALAHTPCGGRVGISVRSAATLPTGQSDRHDAQPGHGWVVFAVSDTGVGIAPEHLPNIFERFFRADPARARATGGAGLGLAIVRQLVEMHGGHVWAESAPGAGTTLSFAIPAAPAYRPASRADSVSSASTVRAP
jgi:signal transduction histidine kinase